MTSQEALLMANSVLDLAGDPPLRPPVGKTECERVETVLHDYAERVRLKHSWYAVFKEDERLPDALIRRLVDALKEMQEEADPEPAPAPRKGKKAKRSGSSCRA